MSVERLLPISTATMAALGTLLLGMGQRDERLPMLVLLAAVLSVWLTDVTKWFRLNRYVASVVAVVASLVAFREAMPLDSVVSVLAIGQLLVYLQIILLFQRKETRTYWQLLVLSLLQVVVATVFNQAAAFGVLLVVYLFVALTTLTLLFLFREAQHYRKPPEPVGHEAPTGRLWPLAAQQPVFSGDSRAKRLQRPMVARELFGRVAKMGLGTLALTALAFFILPRFGRPAWPGMSMPAQQVVGFSDEVRLGELGKVVKDPKPVMRVKLTDEGTGRVHTVDEALYLHGAVLTRYRDRRWSTPEASDHAGSQDHHGFLEGRGPRHWSTWQWAARPGRWGRRHDLPGSRADRYQALEPVVQSPAGDVVEENITIEPMNRRELFTVRPYFVTEAHPELQVDPRRERLLRQGNLCFSQYTFTLKTTAFHGGHQTTLVPCAERPDEKELLKVPADDVPSLVHLARRWMAEPGLPVDRRADRAKYLERRLRDSGQFTYSLEPQHRDPAIDPIEDFITNHPQGHCEYFATALALMLRSENIPARVVVGYKCDEYNHLGNFFQVRQLHAHTWVEAYLEPEHLAGETEGSRWRHGAWLRLDATPSGGGVSGIAADTLFAPFGRGLDWFDSLWNNYVMGMDRSRQRKAIYEPVVRWFEDTWQCLANPEWWHELWRNIRLAFDPRQWRVSQWFSLRGGLRVVIGSLLLVLLFRATRAFWRVARRWLRRGEDAGEFTDRVEVEFYRRLGTLLARHGLRRRTGQTQREFARRSGLELAERLGDSRLALLPSDITTAFYQVRFGRLPLDKPRREAVEQALAQLNEAQERKPVS